jgi:hypothetical protein
MCSLFSSQHAISYLLKVHFNKKNHMKDVFWKIKKKKKINFCFFIQIKVFWDFEASRYVQKKIHPTIISYANFGLCWLCFRHISNPNLIFWKHNFCATFQYFSQCALDEFCIDDISATLSAIIFRSLLPFVIWAGLMHLILRISKFWNLLRKLRSKKKLKSVLKFL